VILPPKGPDMWKDFDKHFAETHQRIRTVQRVMLWVVLPLSLAFLGGCVYVAVHFLRKVW
jgi:hypothetical protein